MIYINDIYHANPAQR